MAGIKGCFTYPLPYGRGQVSLSRFGLEKLGEGVFHLLNQYTLTRATNGFAVSLTASPIRERQIWRNYLKTYAIPLLTGRGK